LKHGYREPAGDPNSTDIHSVLNEKEISYYMAKYISKTPDIEDYPNILLCDYYKLFPTCKAWGCSRALSNINITLSEEDQQTFRDETDWMKAQYSKEGKQEQYYNLYFHSLTKDTPFPPVICDKLSDAYTVFSRKEKRQLKFAL
jgi:hypothetical protein